MTLWQWQYSMNTDISPTISLFAFVSGPVYVNFLLFFFFSEQLVVFQSLKSSV